MQSVTHQTPVRLVSEVNFSPLMVQGARQAAQLQAAVSLLSRHKTENIRFSLQHILNCKRYTSLCNKYSFTKHSSGNVVSSQNPETPCPCRLHPAGTL